jgi:hypothetical protein
MQGGNFIWWGVPNTRKDVTQLKAFLDELRAADWLGTSRQWWPKYLFHFTDVHNAASILNTGWLYSRNEAERLGLMSVDNASVSVLTNTPPAVKEYARLYWRPRTPTQFRNEGVRPRAERTDAHCPVPVYLLFDALTVLADPSTCWCDGTLAGHSHVPLMSQDVDDLRLFPFHLIYHDSAIRDGGGRSEIIRWRHAEVVAPTRLTLDGLRYVVCRSEAERETLLSLLTASKAASVEQKLLVDSRLDLFFRRWVYVVRVEKGSSSFQAEWSAAEVAGPFHVRVEFTIPGERTVWLWEADEYTCTGKVEMELGNVPHHGIYKITITLDDTVAYRGTFRVGASATSRLVR